MINFARLRQSTYIYASEVLALQLSESLHILGIQLDLSPLQVLCDS